MAAYATTTDLANLGLPSQLIAGIPSAQQSAALDSASATVDSYLSARFILPLKSWGQDLTRATCELAAWSILSTRGFDPDSGGDAAVRQRFEDTMRWLRDVADERATPAGVVDGSSSGTTIAPKIFTNTPRGW